MFHNYFSSAIPPVLSIFPGDTVESWSVDAGGVDAQGKRRSPGGNPLTGPFYVEGVMPGDTLVIHFTRIRLSRDSAQSGQRVTLSALNPGYFAQQQNVPNFDSNWALDRQAGFAQLSKPTDKLKGYRVPLKPVGSAFQGCSRASARLDLGPETEDASSTPPPGIPSRMASNFRIAS